VVSSGGTIVSLGFQGNKGCLFMIRDLNLNKVCLLVVVVILLIAPIILPKFIVYLLTYGLIMVIAALALNLLIGYSGLISFGHGIFIGAGAYTVAFMMKYTRLHSFEILIPLSFLISAVLAAILGLFCTRQIRIYFAMLTLAFGELLFALFTKLYDVTGGNDGIHVNMPTLFGHVLKAGTEFYYFVFVLMVVCAVGIWVICKSPFGTSIQAVRDNEIRVGYLGLVVTKYRFITFIISGAFTGLSGALVVSLTGHAVPELFQVQTSITIVMMVLLGGHNLFFGPAVGSIVFEFLQSFLQPLYIWQFFLGVSIIFLVIFLPGGVLGGIQTWARRAWVKKPY